METKRGTGSGDLVDVADEIAPVLVTDKMGKLHFGEQPVALSRLDRSYVAIAAKAINQDRDLALIYPSSPTYLQLPVLLAAGYQNFGPPPVLFVSNRSGAGIREQYFDVGIGDRLPNAPVRSLADFTAPLVKTGDGRNLSHVTHHKPPDWDGDHRGISVIHSTLGKKIASDFPSEEELPLSGIVLDLTTKLLDDFSVIEQYQTYADRRNIPLLYVFDTPCHRHLDRLEQQNAERPPSEQTLFWGYSHGVLEEAGETILGIESSRSSFDPNKITPETVDQSSPFEGAIPVLQNIISGVDREITELTYADLRPAATEAYDSIRKVARYVQRQRDSFPRSVRQTMSDLYFTYTYLSTLPTSVEFHDDIMAFDTGWGAGSTLDQMIKNVRKNYQSIENDVTGAGNMLQDACDDLSRMEKHLVRRNPKADQIVNELNTAIENDESLVVLTATDRLASVLRSFVTEQAGISTGQLDGAGVEFHSLYNTHTIPLCDRLVFPGVPSKSHRPAVMSGAAPSQTYLTYDWETERLEYWLGKIENVADQRCGASALRYTVEQLGVDHTNFDAYISVSDTGRAPVPIEEEDTDDDQSDEKVDTDSEANKTRKQGVGGNRSTSVGASDSAVKEDAEVKPETFIPDSDAFDNPVEYFDDGEEKESVNEGRETEMTSESQTVSAVKIELSGRTHIYERPDGLLWVYNQQGSSGKKRTRKAANALEEGDIILITEQESRRDIFEHIVEKIRSEVPEFKKYSRMLEYWQTNFTQVMAENNLSPDAVARDLQAYADEHDLPDASRTSQAVRGWAKKETIGPSDHEVIEALGEIYDINVYRELAMEIQAALEEIRVLHRQVGRHLDKILFNAGTEESDTWLFREFNIRVDDVQDAVEYRKVTRVSEEEYDVNGRDLGRLFKS